MRKSALVQLAKLVPKNYHMLEKKYLKTEKLLLQAQMDVITSYWEILERRTCHFLRYLRLVND